MDGDSLFASLAVMMGKSKEVIRNLAANAFWKQYTECSIEKQAQIDQDIKYKYQPVLDLYQLYQKGYQEKYFIVLKEMKTKCNAVIQKMVNSMGFSWNKAAEQVY